MIFDWSPEQDLLLMECMDGLKPTGVQRHFRMVSITKKFNEKSETKMTPLDIWKHLNTLWDMAEVERLEGLDVKTLGFESLNEYWEFALNPIEEFDGMVKEVPHEQEEETAPEPQKEAEAPTETAPVSSDSKSTTKTRRQAARRASSRLNVNTSGVDVTGASAKSSAVEDTASQNEAEYASEASLASHMDAHHEDDDRGSSTGNGSFTRFKRTSSGTCFITSKSNEIWKLKEGPRQWIFKYKKET